MKFIVGIVIWTVLIHQILMVRQIISFVVFAVRTICGHGHHSSDAVFQMAHMLDNLLATHLHLQRYTFMDFFAIAFDFCYIIIKNQNSQQTMKIRRFENPILSHSPFRSANTSLWTSNSFDKSSAIQKKIFKHGWMKGKLHFGTHHILYICVQPFDCNHSLPNNLNQVPILKWMSPM